MGNSRNEDIADLAESYRILEEVLTVRKVIENEFHCFSINILYGTADTPAFEMFPSIKELDDDKKKLFKEIVLDQLQVYEDAQRYNIKTHNAALGIKEPVASSEETKLCCKVSVGRACAKCSCCET